MYITGTDIVRSLFEISSVVGRFADGYAPWMWLTTPPPSLCNATPLALLERDEIDCVTDAVRESLQGDFV